MFLRFAGHFALILLLAAFVLTGCSRPGDNSEASPVSDSAPTAPADTPEVAATAAEGGEAVEAAGAPESMVDEEEDLAITPPDLEEDAPPVPEAPFPMARVNGEVITSSDVDAILSRQIGMPISAIPADQLPPLRMQALDALIEAKIVAEMIRNSDVTVTDSDVDAEVQNIKDDMGGEDVFNEALASRGLDEDTLRVSLKETILFEKYRDETRDSVELSEEEVQEAYAMQKEAGNLEAPETAEISHIMVYVPEDASEEDAQAAKAKIDAAYERLQAGESFEEVAKAVSEDEKSAAEGGHWGMIAKGDTDPDIEYHAFATEVGEITEPFRSGMGYHILLVEDKKEPHTITLDEIRDEFVESLKDQKVNAELQKQMAAYSTQVNVEILTPTGSPEVDAASAEEATADDGAAAASEEDASGAAVMDGATEAPDAPQAEEGESAEETPDAPAAE